MSKKYLVTGGAGFIGSFVVQSLLAKGHKVVVLDNFDDFYDYKLKLQNIMDAIQFDEFFSFSNDKESDIRLLVQRSEQEDFSLFYGDLTNPIHLDKVFQSDSYDTIIHLAALAGVRPSIEEPLRYENVNVNGSNLLLEKAKQYGIKNHIIASSSSVYGNNEKIPFSETDRVDFPISPYASTKKSVEVMSHVYHQLYDFNIIQLRFFTVYGPRQRPDLAIHKFCKLIDNKEEIPFYGDGSTARDYTYIDDIIQGVLESIDYAENNTKVFEIINLGESKVISLNEMVETLEKHVGKKANKKMLPMQPGDVERTYADISKAQQLLNYKPTTDFDNGVQQFVEWFRKQEVYD